jgi:uncharacterized protein (DUF1697 family)
VALLRGINVGGNNVIAMADLCQVVADAGMDDVRTYIQSGNVLFASDRPRASLEAHLETTLAQAFGRPLTVVVRSHHQMRNVVTKAPEGFGASPDTYHCDAVFLRSPLTPAGAMEVVQLRDGVDEVWPGTGVIYFARLSAQRTRSKMHKIVGTPQYRLMTIRSWSTTTKLLALLDDASRSPRED